MKVIILTKDDPDDLEKLLLDLKNQSLEAQEIIIADAGSEKENFEKIKEKGFKTFREKKPFYPRVLNEVLNNIEEGEVVILKANQRVKEDFLERVKTQLRENTILVGKSKYWKNGKEIEPLNLEKITGLEKYGWIAFNTKYGLNFNERVLMNYIENLAIDVKRYRKDLNLVESDIVVKEIIREEYRMFLASGTWYFLSAKIGNYNMNFYKIFPMIFFLTAIFFFISFFFEKLILFSSLLLIMEIVYVYFTLKKDKGNLRALKLLPYTLYIHFSRGFGMFLSVF